MASNPDDVGPQNPDLRNSPIVWEYLDDEEWVGLEAEQPGCFYNGVAYETGSFVRCDDAVLECRNGFWKPVATGDPDQP